MLHSQHPQAITILQSTELKICAKRFYPDDGEPHGYGIDPYPKVTKWKLVKTAMVPTLQKLYNIVDKLCRNNRFIVIRGGLEEGVTHDPAAELLRREVNSPKGPGPFVDWPRRWVALDLDKVVMPDGVEEHPIKWLRSQLPAPFQTAGVVYQWTSQYKMKDEGQTLKCRLWFLLDHSMDCMQWRRYFKIATSVPVDTALFRTVQPHYVAAPIFDGLDDPLDGAPRVGKLDGGTVDCQPILKVLAEAPQESEGSVAEEITEANPIQIEHTLARLRKQTTSGSRHDHMVGCAHELVGIGCDKDQGLELLIDLMTEQGRQPDPGECERAWGSAVKKLKAGELKTHNLPIEKFLTDDGSAIDEMIAEIEADDEDLEMSVDYTGEANASENGEIFMVRNKLHGKLLRWDGDDFIWAGTHWVRMFPEELRCTIQRDVGTRFAPKFVSEMLAYVRGKYGYPRIYPGCWIGEEANHCEPYVNFQNGRISLANLEKGNFEMEAHEPRVFNLVSLQFAFDAKAKCPRWEQFVDACFGKDDYAQKREFQKMFGYLLGGSNAHQKFFMLRGFPRSGKGLTLDVIEGMVGNENVEATSLAKVGNRFGPHSLIGKSVATLDETNNKFLDRDAALAVDTIKSITGGSKVPTEKKNGNIISRKLDVRFVVTANRIPGFVDESGALGARMVLFEYVTSFLGKEDINLGAKLLAELPGIFNWAVKGLQYLADDGRFIDPDSQEDLREAIAEKQAPIAAFCQQCLVDARHFAEADSCVLSKDDIFDCYRAWCSLCGRKAIARQSFLLEIRQHFGKMETVKRREGERRVPCYVGLILSKEGRALLNDPESLAAEELALD